MAATEHADQRGRRADVELRLPADSAYVSVLRTTTAGLAARLDFPIDDIEDLRIAVGEASAMVLPEAQGGTDLLCLFYLAPGELTVTVEVTAVQRVDPDYDSFAWQVLSTLATSAAADSDGGRFSVSLTMQPVGAGSSLTCPPTSHATTARGARSSESRPLDSAAASSSRSSRTRASPTRPAPRPATGWCISTCPSSSTAPAGSATAASRSRTSCRSAPSA